MVLSFQDSVEQMETLFSPCGRELAAWPTAPGHPEEDIARVEDHLDAALPRTFRSAIAKYNFLCVVAANVSMSHATSLEQWLVDPNIDAPPPQGMRWWTESSRPNQLLMVGGSDAHTILLHLQTGEIMAVWIDDPDGVPMRVARTFEDFYRGIATLYLVGLRRGREDSAALALTVAEEVGATDGAIFWSRFAVGAA